MKNKKVLSISILGIILAIVGVIVALYFVTDLFKTEQQLFYKYLGKATPIDSELVTQYSAVSDKIQKNSQSSNANMDISTITQNKQTGAVDTQKILTITSGALKNISSKQYYRDINVESNGMKLLAFKYLQDDNTYGIMEDNIVSKYLAVENKNLKQLFKNIGVPDEYITNIPDSININDLKERHKIDEETLEILKSTYSNVLYNNIGQEKFYKIVNSDKTKTIGVSLTEQDIIDLSKKILETVKNDTVLLNLIVNNAKELKYDDITLEALQEELQGILDSMNNTNGSTDKDFIKISLTVKGTKVIKLEFETNYKEESKNYKGEIVSTTTQKYKLSIEFAEENKVVISMQVNEEPTDKIVLYYNYDNEKIEYTLEIQPENMEDYEDKTICKLSYQIRGYNTDNITCDLEISVLDTNNLPMINNTSTEGMTYNLKLINEIELKQDVVIPKFTNENSVKLNNFNAEQLQNLFMAILNQINEVYFSDKDTIIENNETSDIVLLEDVNISSGFSQINSKIYFSANGKSYVSNDKEIKLFLNYKDYIKLDIYYVENEEERMVVDYKAVLKLNNEDVTNVKTEEELRTKIGLYTTGIYTTSFTFLEKGGGGSQGGIHYLVYVFADSENNEYKMRCLCDEEEYRNMYIEDKLGLIANNKYNVTFEVVKNETFGGYDYYIKGID